MATKNELMKPGFPRLLGEGRQRRKELAEAKNGRILTTYLCNRDGERDDDLVGGFGQALCDLENELACLADRLDRKTVNGRVAHEASEKCYRLGQQMYRLREVEPKS